NGNVRDKRHGCERFEGWLGSKHQPRAQCKKPLIKDQGLFNLVVDFNSKWNRISSLMPIRPHRSVLQQTGWGTYA
ncbi:MAG: hypothetical protein KA742_03805, partial [Pseudoxanthomonas sp.]|nr:hypothetical protein [Pseudoxanthomonas sp.]